MDSDIVYVFGYGSLLEPDSLHRSVPEVEIQNCIPATVQGFVRRFDVVFPNDGSQSDKAYFDADGNRARGVLLCNIDAANPSEGRGAGVPDWGSTGNAGVNGICIPVGPAEFAALRARELRYREVDLSRWLRTYPGWKFPDRTGRVGTTASRTASAEAVIAFAGREEFTRPGKAERGILPREYLQGIQDGATHWEAQVSGFVADFEASTELPPVERIQSLHRVDYLT